MISIDRHIEYLLIEHDCVIVPGFGAFVVMLQNARIEGDIILPPVRKVGFNPDITHNDGLLTSSIARRERISYEAACKAVAYSVAALQKQLERDRAFNINRVGSLRLENSRISFEPAAESVAQLRFNGLTPVKARLISATSHAVKAEPSPNVVYIPVSRSLFRVAASIIGLIMIGILCTTTMLVDRIDVNYASVAPTVTAPKTTSVRSVSEDELQELTQQAMQETDVQTGITSAGIEAAVAKEPSAAAEALKSQSTEPQQDTFEPATPSFAEEAETAHEIVVPGCDGNKNETHEYCIVVGSFKTRSRANAFINASNDSSLWILKQDGRYRICVAAYAEEDTAKAAAADAYIQSRYPGAWVTEN